MTEPEPEPDPEPVLPETGVVGLAVIEAKDWAGEGKMLGETEAEEGADWMLELGEAVPVEEACGYGISSFMGADLPDTDTVPYSGELPELEPPEELDDPERDEGADSRAALRKS